MTSISITINIVETCTKSKAAKHLRNPSEHMNAVQYFLKS